MFHLALLILVTLSRSQTSYPSTGCSSNVQPAQNNETKEFSLTMNGTNIKRSYYVHVPIDYDHHSASGQAVVLALHGYSGTAHGMSADFGMVPQSNLYNYLAVFPQGSYMRVSGREYSSWNDLSCSGSPGPDGPTCDVLHTEQLPMTKECKDPDGNHCNWCNCNSDDIGFIDQLLTDKMD